MEGAAGRLAHHFDAVRERVDVFLTAAGLGASILRQSGVKTVDLLLRENCDETVNSLVHRHRALVLVAALGLPLLACLLIAPFRVSVENTNAALLLVLLVVAAAATGLRFAGVVAAVSSAVWFDFFLTAPYHRLAITDRADVETAVLLVLVGLATTEVSLWGHRQQGQASRQQGYLAGVLGTISSAAEGGADADELTRQVAAQLSALLGVDDCRFSDQPVFDVAATLHRNGSVTRSGHPVDVERDGLPTDTEIELAVQSGGMVLGRYLLTASTRIRRPGLEQRQVAVALADQVGSARRAAAGPVPTANRLSLHIPPSP